MSYSFSITRATKAEALEGVMASFAQVVEAQPVHAVDIDHAKAAAAALLDLTFDDPIRDIVANVSGSVWQTDAGVKQVSLSINIGHADRKPAEATA